MIFVRDGPCGTGLYPHLMLCGNTVASFDSLLSSAYTDLPFLEKTSQPSPLAVISRFVLSVVTVVGVPLPLVREVTPNDGVFV